MELIRKLKNIDDVNANGRQQMSVLAIFEKIKETERKFSKGSSTVL